MGAAILILSGSMAGWAVLLKVLHALDPQPGVFELLAGNLIWTVLSPLGCVLLFAGLYHLIGAAFAKWGKIANYEDFSGKLAIPFLFFAFWIIKPFVNYQRGIFTGTAILAVLTLILLLWKESRRPVIPANAGIQR